MPQPISEVMTKKVVTLRKMSLIKDAIDLMSKKGISCIVIVDSKQFPEGIITERDMVRRVLQMGINPYQTNLAYVMTSPVVSMRDDQDVFDAIDIMQKHNFRRVVVTDKNDRLAGIVTQTDLFKGIKRIQTELEDINKKLRSKLRSLEKFARVGKKSKSRESKPYRSAKK